jgi:UDP-N-acetylglucosamine 2-epimerase (non-hydrolysing)
MDERQLLVELDLPIHCQYHQPLWRHRRGSTIEELTGTLQREFTAHQPDMVFVFGDVDSAVAGTRAASRAGIPVFHVEAGLRSYDATMPEERNRVEIDRTADILFAPDPLAADVLLSEGLPRERVVLAGNTITDTLGRLFPDAGWEPTDPPYAVLTIHRESNVGSPEALRKTWSLLDVIHRHCPLTLFPLHPITKQCLKRAGYRDIRRLHRIRVQPPQSYRAMVTLIRHARVVISDSGGIQEETTALGVPCLTLRTNTERPLTVSRGTNILVGTRPSLLTQHLRRLLLADIRDQPRAAVPGWDGCAGSRIIAAVQSYWKQSAQRLRGA